MKYYHNCFGLLVDDVEEAAKFYSDALGYKIKRKEDSFVEFDTGGGPITFFAWQWDHLERHLGKDVMSKVKHRLQCAIFFDNPDDVDKAYAKLSEQGVKFLTEPQDWEWQAYAAYFLDEDGFMWEIYSWKREI